jgi:hypothetical protein
MPGKPIRFIFNRNAFNQYKASFLWRLFRTLKATRHACPMERGAGSRSSLSVNGLKVRAAGKFGRSPPDACHFIPFHVVRA